MGCCCSSEPSPDNVQVVDNVQFHSPPPDGVQVAYNMEPGQAGWGR